MVTPCMTRATLWQIRSLSGNSLESKRECESETYSEILNRDLRSDTDLNQTILLS